jgi:cobalamin-dependent methionine synthase I
MSMILGKTQVANVIYEICRFGSDGNSERIIVAAIEHNVDIIGLWMV